ncbi:MAG: NGG1p interacting factor NIF3 [Thermodesulfovibrionales bacterium]|nr:NGG1p interacting factor NIF3 [Thermodesulfovibrionales bacterium]
MTLEQLYRKAVSTGMDHDPRGREAVLAELEAKKKDYDGLKESEREFFDAESLRNPYADTRILNGTGEEKIASCLVGIDIDTSEVLLCDTLRQKGRPIDLVISHHPAGRAYAGLHGVMQMQADILSRFGVPINIAEDLMEGRIREVQRRIMPVNHSKAVDAAMLLAIPFACIHTPADNMVATHLQRLCDEKKPYKVSDIIDMLRGIPEYRDAAGSGAGPEILIGSKSRKAGRVFVDMTGGTEGSKEIFGSLTQSGVNTIIAMHLGEEHRKEAEKNHLNVVIAGHIASDNVGLNLLLDELSGDAALDITCCSGFKRVARA